MAFKFVTSHQDFEESEISWDIATFSRSASVLNVLVVAEESQKHSIWSYDLLNKKLLLLSYLESNEKIPEITLPCILSLELSELWVVWHDCKWLLGEQVCHFGYWELEIFCVLSMFTSCLSCSYFELCLDYELKPSSPLLWYVAIEPQSTIELL